MAEKIKSFDFGCEPEELSKSFSSFEVTQKKYLSFTNIVANNNKFWAAEIHVAKDLKARIYTNYGRVGGAIAKEVRYLDSEQEAISFLDKLVKGKNKKGYVEVLILKADVGSEEGKAKVEVSKITAEEAIKLGAKLEDTKSNLHEKVQKLIVDWFGITKEYIQVNLDTAKCPLGQLSLEQINKGKQLLDDVRALTHKKKDIDELNKLTSLYYSNIPHKLSHKIDIDELRFDSDLKIDKAFDFLDVLFDSKNIENVINKRTDVDAKYSTLNSDIEYIDPKDPVWKWLNRMFLETRANNHHFLGKIKLHNAFKVSRKGEFNNFISNADWIAKECGTQNVSRVYKDLVKIRPDVPKEYQEIYNKANILPTWHGSRRANMIGITTKGLLIRPSGVIHTGNMYGDAIYSSSNSTKAVSYIDLEGSYWARGGKTTVGYLYLMDCALGKQKIAKGSGMYNYKGIQPYHSVYAEGGYSGVINDEYMIYQQTGKQQQHMIKYVLEVEINV